MTNLVEESFGSEVVRASDGELDGRPAGFVLANDSLIGSGSNIDLTIIYAVTVGNLGMYTVKCGSVRKYFDRFQPEFTRIIRSFDIDEDF
jgi:hypothetical protein